MAGRLNTFQKAMLHWNDIHPYNAVHIVQVLRKLDKVRLGNAITEVIRESGLGGLCVDRRRCTYAFTGGSEGIELRFVSDGAEISSVLAREVEAELNKPFPDSALSPFRFFAIQSPDYFHLGIVYFHVIAGAESIVFLLRNIVKRYMESGSSTCCQPLDLYPRPTTLRAFIRPSLLAGQLRQLMRQIANVRSSCRPRYHKIKNNWNAYTTFVIERDRFMPVVAAAKRWGVTLNDYFLAVILRSVAPLAGARLTSPRRRQITIASISNIRKDLNIAPEQTFGLFLGSFSVSHEVPDEISLESLARDLHQQTEQIKKYKTYLLSPIELKAAEILISIIGQDRRSRIYEKNYPLWAGITNMNLNPIWPLEQRDGLGDYLRGVSTGPITPCVFAITTIGDRVNVGVSYREAVYKQDDMMRVVSRFIRAIEEAEGYR